MIGHIVFDKNNRYMLVGENHDGDYVFDFNDDTHINNLHKLIIANENKLTLWHEGPTSFAISLSFKNFHTNLTAWLTKNNIKSCCDIIVKGWETDGVKFDKKDEKTCILLGVSPGFAIQALRPYLDGNRSMLDAIISSRKFMGEDSIPVTKKECIEALMDGNKPSDVLIFIQQPKSATMTNLKKMYSNDENKITAKYFEGVKNPMPNSELYKRIKRFNEARDVHLSQKLKFGGIFLAGNDHVPAVEKLI